VAKKKASETVFDLVETIDGIRNSALKYPLFYVDGSGDVLIFGQIARRSGTDISGISPCGGRNTLIQVFEAFHGENLTVKRPILFFTDRDTYVFDGIPPAYHGIHFKEGYSIENDLFQDGYHALMAGLFPDEQPRFESLIGSVSHWFASELVKVKEAPGQAQINISLLNPNMIAPRAATLSPEFSPDRGYTNSIAPSGAEIVANYGRLLRGHFLPQLFAVSTLIGMAQRPREE